MSQDFRLGGHMARIDTWCQGFAGLQSISAVCTTDAAYKCHFLGDSGLSS